MKKFFILLLCFLLLLSLAAPCLAFFAEAAGMMGASGAMGYFGVGATSSAFGTQDFNDAYDEFWNTETIGLGNPQVRYNDADGSLSYNADDLNTFLAWWQSRFGNGLVWKPPALNVSSEYDFGWHIANNGFLDTSVSPPTYRGDSSMTLSNEAFRLYSKSFNLDELPVGTNIYLESDYVPPALGDAPNYTYFPYKDSSYNVTSQGFGVRIKVNNSWQELSANNGIYTIPDRAITDIQLYFTCRAKTEYTGGKPNQHTFTLLPSAVSLLLSIHSNNGAFDVDGDGTEMETTFSIVEDERFTAISDATDKVVTVKYYDENGNNILAGVPSEDVPNVLRDAVFNGQVASVSSTADTGTLADDTPDVIGGLFGLVNSIKNYIAQLLASFPVWFSNLRDAVIEAIHNATPHFGGFELPPGLIPSGGDGFGLGGIWYYVKAWLGSMAAGIGFFFSQVYANIPSAIVIPIYATAVIVIVVGLFKRYIH